MGARWGRGGGGSSRGLTRGRGQQRQGLGETAVVVGASAGAGGGRGLTHAALAVRCALEAGVAGALEGTNDVDALAVGTQAVTQGAFINVCRGSTWLVGTAGRGGAPGKARPVFSRHLQDPEALGHVCTPIHSCSWHPHATTGVSPHLTLVYKHAPTPRSTCPHTCTPTRPRAHPQDSPKTHP